jgi:putative ABC transport system substrate-binding protein
VRSYDEARTAAPVLDLTVVPVVARNPEDFAPALSAAVAAHLDALYVVGGGVVLSQKTLILEFAATNRLPSIVGFSRAFVDSGALMYYGEDVTSGIRRAAQYIDRILRGAKPADLPIEMTSQFDFIINLKTARALGLTIPKSVLDQATEIIP